MTGCTVRRYEQLKTSSETIEQELRPAVCERWQTDRQENYSIDKWALSERVFIWEWFCPRGYVSARGVMSYIHTSHNPSWSSLQLWCMPTSMGTLYYYGQAGSTTYHLARTPLGIASGHSPCGREQVTRNAIKCLVAAAWESHYPPNVVSPHNCQVSIGCDGNNGRLLLGYPRVALMGEEGTPQNKSPCKKLNPNLTQKHNPMNWILNFFLPYLWKSFFRASTFVWDRFLSASPSSNCRSFLCHSLSEWY